MAEIHCCIDRTPKPPTIRAWQGRKRVFGPNLPEVNVLRFELGQDTITIWPCAADAIDGLIDDLATIVKALRLEDLERARSQKANKASPYYPGAEASGQRLDVGKQPGSADTDPGNHDLHREEGGR